MMYAIRTTGGGPADGDRMTDDLAAFGLSWPLPDELPLPPEMARLGRYVKVTESDLPPDVADHPGLAMGVEYRWESRLCRHDGCGRVPAAAGHGYCADTKRISGDPRLTERR